MSKSIEQKQSEAIGKMITNKQEKIQTIYNDIKQLQERCPHFGLIKTNGANTGNWSKAYDTYWYDYKCPHCGKSWRIYDEYNIKNVD